MIKGTLSGVALQNGGALLGKDRDFRGISTDSRTVQRGQLFFAIRGEHYDGHDFAEDALSRGAAGAVVERELSGSREVVVKDTLKTLGSLAGDYRRSLSTKVIVVTGSVGKTTTKEMLALVLSQKYRVTKAGASFNNAVGLPLSIADVNPRDDFAVLEAGANAPGEIAYLASIAQPDVAVLTRMGRSHTAGFGSVEGVVQEKSQLVRAVRPGGWVLYNADSPGGEVFRAALREEVAIQSYSLTCSGETCGEYEDLRLRLGDTTVSLPAAHRGMAENALAAWCVGQRFGIEESDAAEALSAFKPLAGRMESVEAGGVILVNDAYNANPDSLAALLESSARREGPVLLLGDMLELDEAGEAHREAGRLAAEAGVVLLVTVGRLARLAGREAESMGVETVSFQTPEEAAQYLIEEVLPGQTLLFKGSHAVGLERAFSAVKKALEGGK